MAVHDDVIYGTLLIICTGLGFFVKNISDIKRKQYLCSGIGGLIVLLVCGKHSLHSLITVVGNIIIIKCLGPRQCHLASFIWSFSYIVFFRTTHLFGLPPIPAHTNAIQLLLTLKLAGVAFEVHDSHYEKAVENSHNDEENEKQALKQKYQQVNPSVSDLFMYSYCYIGMLTGPYYKFRTYKDMLQQKKPEAIDTQTPFFNRLKMAPIYGLAFIITSQFYWISYVETEEFNQSSFLYRLWYMVPMFFIFRMRFYSAWVLSECMCMAAGLGAYPKASKPRSGQGPTDFKALEESMSSDPSLVEYDFETIHNINEYGTEFLPTCRDGMRYWNMTVQYWLANNVYKRAGKAYRTSLTMAVSAFWHGIHPGYYLSFLSAPPFMLAEGAMAAAFRDNKSPRQQKIFDWCNWFIRMRFFEYGAMAFMLLELKKTLQYWSNVYFIIHVLNIIFLIIGKMYAPKKSKEESGKKL